MNAKQLRIRSENRYILHPQDKKRCSACEIVYNDIATNFDIHRKVNDVYQYEGKCKPCRQNYRRTLKKRIVTDTNWYFRKLICQIRHRAKSCDLQFNLTAHDLQTLWTVQDGKCFYTGEVMDFSANNGARRSPHIDFPSVDKVIPELGYVVNNIVLCKWGVNRMKNNLTKDQFVAFCRQVVIKHA